MALSAAQMAGMSRLLDEALEFDREGLPLCCLGFGTGRSSEVPYLAQADGPGVKQSGGNVTGIASSGFRARTTQPWSRFPRFTTSMRSRFPFS
jgi:hypothetical protein